MLFGMIHTKNIFGAIGTSDTSGTLNYIESKTRTELQNPIAGLTYSTSPLLGTNIIGGENWVQDSSNVLHPTYDFFVQKGVGNLHLTTSVNNASGGYITGATDPNNLYSIHSTTTPTANTKQYYVLQEIKVDDITQPGTSYTFNAGGVHTFYAAFQGDSQYNTIITFEKYGGSGGTPAVTAYFGSDMPSASAPTRDGYTFEGYDSLEGKRYYNSSMNSVNTWDSIAFTATLYAMWTKKSYTLSLFSYHFVAGYYSPGTTGGTVDIVGLGSSAGATDSASIQWGTTSIGLSATPASGYEFLGWSYAYGTLGDNPINDNSSLPYGNIGNAYSSDTEITMPMGVTEIIALFSNQFWIGDYQLSTGFSGSGTASDPYKINNEYDLALLSKIAYEGGSFWYLNYTWQTHNTYFRLMDDIDLTGKLWYPIGVNSDYQRFTGFFDGNNKTIINMTINSTTTTTVGLFGTIGGDFIPTNSSWRNVFDLNLTGTIFIDTHSNLAAGGLVGQMIGGNIYNCWTDVDIVANSDGYVAAGGIIGSASYISYITITDDNLNINNVNLNDYTMPSIINCGAAGNITASSDKDVYVGGIVGVGAFRCYASFPVQYQYEPWNSEIISCYYGGGDLSGTATTIDYDVYLGGIIGFAAGHIYIESSYTQANSGSTSVSGDGEAYKAGIVGYSYYIDNQSYTYTDISNVFYYGINNLPVHTSTGHNLTGEISSIFISDCTYANLLTTPIDLLNQPIYYINSDWRTSSVNLNNGLPVINSNNFPLL